ncbi:MAG: hypothetical protein JRI25_06215 [Deltaproteobacteria bacterium]|nr:hypothetical protein [Deltaproteobacteria bacterium]
MTKRDEDRKRPPGTPRATSRRVLPDGLVVPDEEEVRPDVVEKARADVKRRSLHQEVDIDHVMNSLLPDL